MHSKFQLFISLQPLIISVIFLTSCAGLSGNDKQNIFYPTPPNSPRIQYLTSFSGSGELTSNSHFSRLVSSNESSDSAPIKKPYGIAIHNNVIYVVDIEGSGYTLFDLSGKNFKLVSDSFSGKMKKPVNISIDKNGYKYITDTVRSLVLVYNKNNKFVKTIGDGKTFKPTDVLIVDDKLFVTDIKNHRIIVLDKTSNKLLYTIGSMGSKEGELLYPTHLALGPDNHLYVCETTNFRVQKFTLDGQFVKSYGKVGPGLGQFARPKGIAVDREGRIHVVNTALENVQIIDNDGKLLMVYGEPGSNRTNINLPTDITIDYEHVNYFRKYANPEFQIEYIILVSSQLGNSKVNVFSFGHMKDMNYQNTRTTE